jgi:hypothetical protein
MPSTPSPQQEAQTQSSPFPFGTLGHINDSSSKGKWPNGKYDFPRPCPLLGAIEFLVSTAIAKSWCFYNCAADSPGFPLGFSCAGAPKGARTERRQIMKCRTKFPLRTILVVISIFSSLGVEKADWNRRCLSDRLSKDQRRDSRG